MQAAARTDEQQSAPSRARWDAIVVGSGVGGLVTAALLGHAGWRVLVLEKNPVLGGILAARHHRGFKMDTGSHLVSRGARGPLGQVLRAVGLDHPRFLTHPIPVRSRGMLSITAPSTRAGLPRVALEAARKLRLPPSEVAHLGRLLFQMLTLTEPELRRWDRRTLDAFIRQHTDHPGAYFLFGFLASIFFVLPPWQVSAGEAIRCLRRLLLDYSLSYVEGGMDALAGALLERVRAAGGEALTMARVVAIGRDAAGLRVVTEDGRELRASVVACNLAPPDLLPLLEGEPLPAAWVEEVQGIVPSGNAHQVKLALRRPLVDEGCLIAGVSLAGLTLEDLSLSVMERAVADIRVGRVSDPLAIYAPVPTNYDPSLAPDGGQLILASVYGPTLEDPADPPERWRERILDAFAAIVPGLRDELLFCDFTPVPSIGRWMGKSSNGAICNGQLPGQVGADRLPVRTPVDGLYLCGDGAGGRGIGTELAAESAREVVRDVLRHHRQPEAG